MKYMNDTQINMIRAGLRQTQLHLDETQRKLHDFSIEKVHARISDVVANLKCELERLETYHPDLAGLSGCTHGSNSDDCPDCRH